MNERAKAIIRLIVALIPVVNIILIEYGMSPLPFTEEEVNTGLSAILAVIATCYAWWKNNNITIEAQTGQKIINELKQHKDDVGGEGDPLEVE